MLRRIVLAAGLAAGLAAPAAAQTEIKLIGFGGGTNVPSWVAIDKGFFL
jgi:ABC-type nitrate/sulfonate/bicarbonate transport system substrate-binding protein